MVKRIDAAAASKMPGVIAVLTGADYVADGLKGAMQRANPAGAIDIKVRAFAPEKRPVLEEQQYPLVTDRVRYPGEAVAVVVAETLFAGARRRRSGRGRIRRAAGGHRRARGRRRRADLAAARRTTSRSTRSSAMPPRCGRRSTRPISWSSRPSSTSASPTARWSRAPASASYDKAADSYTLISGNQGVHAPRMVLAESWGVPLEKIRFVCPDVGGGFGLRNNLYPEQATILWAAKRVGRPVKWTNDRSESFLTDYAGRDLVTTARLALTKDGRITAYHVDHIGTCGGQTVTYVPLSNAYRVATTVYDIPLMHMRCRSMMTNTVPTAPFRGAGRPEATLVLERLIDLAAEQARHRPAAHPQEERHPEEEAALPHRQRAALRQRRFRRQHGAHDRGRRLEGLCRAQARSPRSAASFAASASRIIWKRRSASRTSASRSRCAATARSSLRSARNRPARATRRASPR